MDQGSHSNQHKNQEHYNKVYRNSKAEDVLRIVNRVEKFLADSIRTDTSWSGFYGDGFSGMIKGRTVLELGCGDCTNAAIMAKLGARVYANDISNESGRIISELNEGLGPEESIHFVEGDFLKADLGEEKFDFVVGKAFVHHLTHSQEELFYQRIREIIKPEGQVRFFEPAENSWVLEKLRWLTPVPGRPSILQRKKFKVWKDNDPHPERDNSSYHYVRLGKKYFSRVEIHPIGGIERMHRFIPNGRFSRKFRRMALRLEKLFPKWLQLKMARSQLVIYHS